ncbi:MAG: hypothetical protein U0165_18175 [Polyangiaceae bacterium]
MTRASFIGATCAQTHRAFAQPQGEQRVEIEADSVDTDLEARDVVLRGNVTVRANRFRVRAQTLRMVRRDDGSISLTGPLEVAPCDCDDPPVWFSVSSAEVSASHSSVSLRRVSMSVGGATLLWTPWLSLRAPSSLGLLAPRMAWRCRRRVACWCRCSSAAHRARLG